MDGKFWFKALLTGLLLTTLVMAGCEGDDGDDGTPGASAYEIAVENGFTGTEQEWLDSLGAAAVTSAEPEQCAVCHSDVAATHAETGVATISNASAALDADGNYVIGFTLEVDGVGTSANFPLYAVYVTYDDPTLDDADLLPATTTNVRDTLYGRNRLDASADATSVVGFDFTSDAAGNYTVTVPVASVVNNAVYTVIVRDLDPTSSNGWGHTEPASLLTLGTSPLRDLVSDDGMSVGCASCHGASASQLFDHYLVQGDECQTCHAIYGRSADSYALIDGVWVNQGSTPGSNFTEYIHGIHNSHNMPGDDTYVRSLNSTTGEPSTFWSVGYPSDMRNCQTCHVTDTQLAAATEAPVSFYLCMTCHQTWDGFVHGHDDDAATPLFSAGDPIFADNNFHRSLTPTTDCMSCHGAVPALNEAGDFHNDFQGHDSHYDSYYRGVNVSFENETNVLFQVDSVAVGADGALTVTWSASEGGVAVDPCNTVITAGPTFQDLRGYLAYAKGDDWVNEFVGSSPGQPSGATSFFPANTTCSANVATTTGLTLDADALAYASKVNLAIGGKAQTQYAATGDTIYLRVPSPTYEFNLDGTPATARRNAVDNSKCLGCHQGTLYQHGGDRVDNEQLCVVCHNPSANDKNNRLDRFQIVNADGTVNTDATYDGKNAETYDMRVMLHAIHGVEQRLETGGQPWVIYRSRGIYGFGLDDTPLPAGWPADGQTINGSTNDSTISHNWVVVHYPKPANDCLACHAEGMFEAADQTKAVGVSIDAGFDWPDQSDDTIIGPSAAACTACHAGAAQRSHAAANGYKANVTKDEMLDKAQ